jgi:hypothetical protein
VFTGKVDSIRPSETGSNQRELLTLVKNVVGARGSEAKIWIDQANYERARFAYDVSFSLGGCGAFESPRYLLAIFYDGALSVPVNELIIAMSGTLDEDILTPDCIVGGVFNRRAILGVCPGM